MTLWPQNGIDDNRDGNHVSLLEEDEIEIYHENDWPSRCSRMEWLEKGPSPLLSLETWNLLTSEIRRCQLEASVAVLKMYRTWLDPFVYALIFLCFTMSKFPEQSYHPLWVFGIFLGIVVVNVCFNTIHRNYQRDVYYPSIKTVLEDLDQRLTEEGHSVSLVVKLTWGGNGYSQKSFLRFTSLKSCEGNWDTEKLAVTIV